MSQSSAIGEFVIGQSAIGVLPFTGTLDDLMHWYGGDLQAAPNGDVSRANGTVRSLQRVYRRLMTTPGEYMSHPGYGAGVRKSIGEVVNIPAITALIRGQMLLEPSVSRTPAPAVSVAATANGVQVEINYTALPDKQPVSLSFPVTKP